MPFVPDKPQDAAAPAKKGFVPDGPPQPVQNNRQYVQGDPLDQHYLDNFGRKVKITFDANNIPNEELVDPPAVEPPKERSWTDDVGDFRITPDMDLRSLWTAIKGAPETVAGIATNAGVAGVAGLTAPFVSENDDDAANYIRDFTAENSYRPYGESAQQLTSALGDAFAPIENAKGALGDKTLEATGSPGLATGAYMAPDILSVLFGPKPAPGKYGTMDTQLGPITTKTKTPPADLSKVGDFLAHNESMNLPPARKTPRVSPDQPPVERARAAGMKVLPSDAERVTGKKPGLVDRMAEAIAPEDVRREMTMDNQGQATTIVREKVKAPEGTRLNDSGIEKLKEPHFGTYEEVQKAINVVPPSEDYLFALDDATQRAGFPVGSNPTVTEVISALRTKARRKKNNPQADDKLEAEGQLAEQAADKLEDAMGAELKATGQEELLTKYQDARTALAELNDVKKSQRGGVPDPQALRKLDKKNPGRMTGGTKLLADIAEDFPELKSSMSGAGKKGAGPADKEGFIKAGAKKAARGVVKGVSKVVPKLADRLLVESDGFQNRMGEAATPTERSYFDDYGKKPAPDAPKGAPPPGKPPQQAGVVPSKAVSLSDRLELAPDAVPNAQQLPDKPDMMTADQIPPTRGDIDFENVPLEERQSLLDTLSRGAEIDIRTGTKGAVGEKELSDLLADQGSGNLKMARPRDMEQLDMPVREDQGPGGLQLTKPPGKTKGDAKEPAVDYEVGDVGDHYVTSKDGAAVAQENGDYLQLKRIDVSKDARRTGQGRAMMRTLLAKADEAGQTLASDVSVSAEQVALYRDLAKRTGRELIENPHTVSAKGSYVSEDPRVPVFEIGPKQQVKKAVGE